MREVVSAGTDREAAALIGCWHNDWTSVSGIPMAGGAADSPRRPPDDEARPGAEMMRARMPSDYQIDSPQTRERVMRFFSEIGIRARYETGANGFSSGCRLDQGALAVDPACRISTMLHEAGHLAITPRCFRSLMDGNLYAGQREMLKRVDDAGLHPDDPLYRAVIQCSDPEATAWAWAAGVALALPGEEIIRDDEYGGEGESIRLALRVRAYAGVHGLAHAGFCAIRERNGVAAWPRLHFWTQEVGYPAPDEATGWKKEDLQLEDAR